MFLYISFSTEPQEVPQGFGLDPERELKYNEAHFIWSKVDTSVQSIRGLFTGYEVREQNKSVEQICCS